MKMKFFYLILILFLVALVAFVVVKQLHQTRSDISTIRVGYNMDSLNYAPFVVALENGSFSDHKILVVAIPLKSGSEVKQALAAGQIDVGLGGAANFFIPIAKGAPIKIISPMTSTPSYLVVRPDNKITAFSDLVGKTIAVGPGGTSDYSIRVALLKENIDAEKINFVDIDKSYRPIALMNKKVVDAAPISEQEWAKYLEAGAVVMKEWESKGYSDYPTPRTVIAVNEDFKSSHPDQMEKFIDALIDGHRFIKDHQVESAQLVSANIKKESGDAVAYSADDIIAIWNNGKIEYQLWYDPVVLADMSVIAVDIGDIKAGLSVDQLFDFSYKDKLQDAQTEIYQNN